MNTINRETFEAWLAAQPEDKEFYYCSNTSCVVASFIHETTNHYDYRVDDKLVYKMHGLGTVFYLPLWILELLWNSRLGKYYREDKINHIKVEHLKKAYAEQFPSTKWDLSPSLESLLVSKKSNAGEEVTELVEAENSRP